jgi:FHA domain
MMRLDSSGTPHLVVLAPDSDRGRRIPLYKDYLVVGREHTCDVRFDDPRVSRTHAALQRHGTRVYVEDLGSSGGTFVNGAATTAARELHAGDVLAFASVTARLESGAVAADETSTMPASTAEAAAVHQIDEQHAGVINNVDRDQYISYVQYVNQQRENFLREVAATKTKARWLAWTGFLMFVVGFGVFAAADLSFIKAISDAIQNGSEPPQTTSPFGREIGGVPFGLAGWALAALGMILLVVGIVLHIIAASRRRRAYSDFPVLPPRADPGPTRRVS